MRTILSMALGALVTSVIYQLVTGGISLSSFGIFTLGMVSGVLLIGIIIAILWNPS